MIGFADAANTPAKRAQSPRRNEANPFDRGRWIRPDSSLVRDASVRSWGRDDPSHPTTRAERTQPLAPNEPNRSRRTNPMAGAERTQWPAPNEANRDSDSSIRRPVAYVAERRSNFCVVAKRGGVGDAGDYDDLGLMAGGDEPGLPRAAPGRGSLRVRPAGRPRDSARVLVPIRGCGGPISRDGGRASRRCLGALDRRALPRSRRRRPEAPGRSR